MQSEASILQHLKRKVQDAQLPDRNESDEDEADQGDKKNPGLTNGKKTKGRVKIKMEFIDNKLRRYTTFSKRKTGIMKKAYELSTLTGTQVMLLVASETGHVYTFATKKLKPMITSEAGKALIQTCLNSPDDPEGEVDEDDQRMCPTGYEETDLNYAASEAGGDDRCSDQGDEGDGDPQEGDDKPTNLSMSRVSAMSAVSPVKTSIGSVPNCPQSSHAVQLSHQVDIQAAPPTPVRLTPDRKLGTTTRFTTAASCPVGGGRDQVQIFETFINLSPPTATSNSSQGGAQTVITSMYPAVGLPAESHHFSQRNSGILRDPINDPNCRYEGGKANLPENLCLRKSYD